MTNFVLADFPAYAVLGLPMGHDIKLDEDKGDCRICTTALFIRSFPGDNHEWLRSFRIGFDPVAGAWAYGTGSCLTAEQQPKKLCMGASLGDVIQIEGTKYRIEPDHNHNIKLVAA